MRISDWSSDVCSSDLTEPTAVQERGHLSTKERGQEMVSDSGGENAADDGPRPLEAGRENNRQQLSLVDDLGESNHGSGREQGFYEMNPRVGPARRKEIRCKSLFVSNEERRVGKEGG